MRLHHAALTVFFIAPVLVTAQENLGTYEDRIAVEDVMARYVWTVDSLDADGYVAVFTDDAVIDSNGSSRFAMVVLGVGTAIPAGDTIHRVNALVLF